jgi:hypothetical protein
MLSILFSRPIIFIVGVLLGAFVLRRNPIAGAKTLDALEKAYIDAKSKLIAKVRK